MSQSANNKLTPTNTTNDFVTTDMTMSKLMNQRNPSLLAGGDLTKT